MSEQQDAQDQPAVDEDQEQDAQTPAAEPETDQDADADDSSPQVGRRPDFIEEQQEGEAGEDSQEGAQDDGSNGSD